MKKNSKENTKILKPNLSNLRTVAKEISNGEVVAFGTETVYGLGADCFNASAVEKIFSLKGRPADNPLICHISSLLQIKDLAAVVPDVTFALAKKFCPGPLTFVFKKKLGVPDITTGGLPTVAVRMPQNEGALDFIAQCGTPLAAPSANISGTVSPTTASHVASDFNGKLKYILDTGKCAIGLESTVLDLTGIVPKILRVGAISKQDIEAVTGSPVLLAAPNAEKPEAPGMKYKHYAPRAELLFSTCHPSMCDSINSAYDNALQNGKKAVILCLDLNLQKYDSRDTIILGSDLKAYAHNIYAALRQADDNNADVIIAEGIPPIGIGSAIINRLIKASNRLV